jgi:hypothetical protein
MYHAGGTDADRLQYDLNMLSCMSSHSRDKEFPLRTRLYLKLCIPVVSIALRIGRMTRSPLLGKFNYRRQ